MLIATRATSLPVIKLAMIKLVLHTKFSTVHFYFSITTYLNKQYIHQIHLAIKLTPLIEKVNDIDHAPYIGMFHGFSIRFGMRGVLRPKFSLSHSSCWAFFLLIHFCLVSAHTALQGNRCNQGVCLVCKGVWVISVHLLASDMMVKEKKWYRCLPITGKQSSASGKKNPKQLIFFFF